MQRRIFGSLDAFILRLRRAARHSRESCHERRALVGEEAAGEIARERGDWPEYYRGVAAALRGEGVPPVDPRDVVQDLRVIEAAHESGRLGITVELNPPAAHVR